MHAQAPAAGALGTQAQRAQAATQFVVSNAALTDLLAIRRQQIACFGRDAYDLFTLLGLALTPQAVRLKAVVDGTLAAYLAAEVNRFENRGWIVTVGTLPQYAGRGIASALLLAAESKLDTPTFRLTVRSHNQRAIDVYERLGYRWCGTHRRYYRDGEDGLIMEKQRR